MIHFLTNLPIALTFLQNDLGNVHNLMIIFLDILCNNNNLNLSKYAFY